MSISEILFSSILLFFQINNNQRLNQEQISKLQNNLFDQNQNLNKRVQIFIYIRPRQRIMQYFKETVVDFNRWKFSSFSELLQFKLPQFQHYLKQKISRIRKIKFRGLIKNKDQEEDLDSRVFASKITPLKLQEKDEDISFQIHLLLRKKKPIFKVEQVRRKIKVSHKKHRQCTCCGKIGAKHKCSHNKCDKSYCLKFKKDFDKKQKSITEPFCKEESVGEQNNFQEQPYEYLQNLVENPPKQLQQSSFNVVKFRKIEKHEEYSIPKIENEEQEQKEENQNDQNNEYSHEKHQIRQKERISENQSKSEVSESRRNKSRVSQQIVPESDEVNKEIFNINKENNILSSPLKIHEAGEKEYSIEKRIPSEMDDMQEE